MENSKMNGMEKEKQTVIQKREDIYKQMNLKAP